VAKIVLMLGGKELGSFPMKTSPFVVGRDAACHVHIDNVGVSRRHCQFTYASGRYLVEDLGSSNGTFCKGQKVSRLPVEDGSQVAIGKYVLVFEDQGLEMLPASGPAAAGAGGGALKTFQLDPGALREQISKADAAAAATSEARRATDVARAYNPDAPVVPKTSRHPGKYFASAVKIVGIAILGASVLIGLLYAFTVL
jgi:predicted component of type VI protein secretion system